MKTKLVAVSLAGLISLTACVQNDWATRETGGTLAGAALGGYVGSNIGKGSGRLAATAAGVLLGGMLGGSVGRSMDQTDRMRAAQALETTPTNQPYGWRNPDTGSNYDVVPTRTYSGNSGQPCRDFTTQAVIDGRRQSIYGSACRQPDGTWQTSGG
jgi:surface antigen